MSPCWQRFICVSDITAELHKLGSYAYLIYARFFLLTILVLQWGLKPFRFRPPTYQVRDFSRMATRLIKTSLSHRGYSLVKMSYPLFGLTFIDMFSSESWFGTDISWLGIPVIIAILVSSHIFLLFLQTDRAAQLFSPIKKGKPPALYLDWLEIDDPEVPQPAGEGTGTADAKGNAAQDGDVNAAAGNANTADGDANAAAGNANMAVRLGLRRLNLSCVDELHLTIWGNLIFKSRSLCGSIIKNGKETIEADEVFKVPFGIISSQDQKKFVELVRKVRPDVVLNKRLTKRMGAKLVKGEDYIQALGAVFLLFVLLDLSFSLFGYLEMLKQYHLAQVAARAAIGSSMPDDAKRDEAEKHFAKAEQMLENPPGISIVKRTILHKGFSTGAVYQSRAEALWYLGKRDDAIKSLETALEYYPKSLRMHLELARWLALNGNLREARKVLSKMSHEHEDVLLPRLYTLVLFSKEGQVEKVKRFYEIYSDQLDLQVFGDEPWWPPGGNRYLNDSWSRDDLHFLLDELVKSK